MIAAAAETAVAAPAQAVEGKCRLCECRLGAERSARSRLRGFRPTSYCSDTHAWTCDAPASAQRRRGLYASIAPACAIVTFAEGARTGAGVRWWRKR